MSNPNPEITSKDIIDTASMMQRVFPFNKEVELRVYAVFSAHNSVAPLISNANLQLIILGAYTADEALNASQHVLEANYGQHASNWVNGKMIASMPFQHLVPVDKLTEMIEKIKNEITPVETAEEAMDAKVGLMEAYARYVFSRAGASAYEKGILTNVLKRFREEIIKPKTNEVV